MSENAAVSKAASPEGMKDQGLQMGQAHEFLILLPLKEGGAERMRAKAKTFGDAIKSIDHIATVHDFRYAIFDNDTRLLFASTYDGGFEQYIKDFSTLIPDQIDEFFGDSEGYPGVRNPEIWSYIAKYQLQSLVFYSAYPDVTVRQIWKGQRVLAAFENLLDQAQS
ncbi:hypothetical protein [Terriglobus sp. ADX1]|uniref:hypothetical protein n=1 Tax=Terriglobus sp. ADX1 TaxID=2794063 RepID=UPI002FE63262